ncbi:Uncharacterized protein HZ326_15836 [Fusarium oxysporum f. sp. albedinis]|nr:Uncharacterized protein HZ326_15836 [Fusarium oxysporum f. sp. albedinis]
MSRFTTIACCLALFVLSGVSAGPCWPSWPSSSVPMSSLEMTSTISQLAESTAAVVSSSTFTKPFQTTSTAVSTDVTSSTYSTTTTEAQAGPGISLIAATTIATTTTSADIESERISSITTASTTTADTMATTSEPTTTSTAPEEPITCADFPNPFNATNGDSFQIVCDTLPRIIFSIGTPIRGISFKACLDVFTQT